MSSIKAAQHEQNSPKRPETALAQAQRPASPIFRNHHQTLLRLQALPSPGFFQLLYFLSLLGFCLLQSLTHFVLTTAAQFLLLPWLLHPDPWPALKPTARATRAVIQISQLQFRPILPHLWLPDPAQPPITSLLCRLSVCKERPKHRRVSGVYIRAALKRLPNIDIPQK